MTVAKGISLFFTIGALIITYKTCSIVGQSKIGSAIGTVVLMYFLAMPSLMMYESSLVVCLIGLSMIMTHKWISFSGALYARCISRLALLWSLILLTRPDAFPLVLVNALLLALASKRQRKSFRRLLALFGLSLIPAAAYYGYSFITLGSFSVSAVCRAFALKEGAKEFLGIPYSLVPLKIFLTAPLLLWTGMAVWGWQRYVVDRTKKWFACYSALAFGYYIVFFSFVSPSVSDVTRYLLPILPFFAVHASIGIAEIWKERGNVLHFCFLFLFLIYAVLPPLQGFLGQAVYERDRGLSFDVITEREIVEHLNAIAEPLTTILVYEVQDRYHLRNDLTLLSLDGITDGKVTPYFSDSDISSFLWKYQPRYWLGNSAVLYRPFLSKSVLKWVIEKTGQTEGDSVSVEGITFTNIRIRESRR